VSKLREGAMVTKKLVFVFNKFYGMLLSDLHALGVANMSTALPVVAPKKSDTFFATFREAHAAFHDLYKTPAVRLVTDAAFRGGPPVVEGLTLDALHALGLDDAGARGMESYLHIMYLCAMVAACGDDRADQMIEHLLRVMQAIEERGADLDDLISEVVNPAMRAVLDKVRVFMTAPDDGMADGTDDESALDAIKESSLGRLAQEISSKIDLSELDIQDPTDVMKLFSDERGSKVIGNIMETVSASLQSKIASGDIRQEELVQDALKVMSSLQGGGNVATPGGNLMQDMLGAIGGLGAMPR
jgi:hypothetical protein